MQAMLKGEAQQYLLSLKGSWKTEAQGAKDNIKYLNCS